MKSAAGGDWVGLPWIAAHPIAYPALEVVYRGHRGLLGSLVLLELRLGHGTLVAAATTGCFIAVGDARRLG
jgi:hypothetical protein